MNLRDMSLQGWNCDRTVFRLQARYAVRIDAGGRRAFKQSLGEQVCGLRGRASQSWGVARERGMGGGDHNECEDPKDFFSPGTSHLL